ncbi:hypothetical protein Agub_g15924 [Astrephomene gubernaculifera]|uniref:BTB domain-containing protein n=1 Tax=Astrephomene gubernaculifera TaxID=47775 RepID=A0AAD3E5B2_9CHLO|nr:hypothetical protein Agub_g15924 [Astrephomene gubernaculifera]
MSTDLCSGSSSNDASRTVARDLLALLADAAETHDVVIKTADERQFPAHRSILIARCSYFKALFKGGFSDSSAPEVDLPGADPDALALLLRFIYGGILDSCNRTVLKPAIELADRLLLNDAQAMLLQRLLSTATAETITHDLLWADERGYKDVVAKLQQAYVQQYARGLSLEAVSLLAEANPQLMARLHMAVLASQSSSSAATQAPVAPKAPAAPQVPAAQPGVRFAFGAPAAPSCSMPAAPGFGFGIAPFGSVPSGSVPFGGKPI